jgi:hypothetical protein
MLVRYGSGNPNKLNQEFAIIAFCIFLEPFVRNRIHNNISIISEQATFLPRSSQKISFVFVPRIDQLTCPGGNIISPPDSVEEAGETRLKCLGDDIRIECVACNLALMVVGQGDLSLGLSSHDVRLEASVHWVVWAIIVGQVVPLAGKLKKSLLISIKYKSLCFN